MLQQIPLIETTGKTLQGSTWSVHPYCSQCVLVFTDGTFSVITADREYPHPDTIISDDEKLDLFHFGDRALIDLGVISAEEISALRQERNKQYGQRPTGTPAS